ncbi:hypothetical protein [Pasteurella bettyae]|uniref:hypothetical protein n=1 Tax=Pasteurella bettyae TaxID=752 RepID=UPI003D28DF26
MTTFSLNLIFDGLKPILTQCKTVAMSVFVLSPVALNTAISTENTPIQIHRIHHFSHKLTESEKVHFSQFADQMVKLIDTINPFIDFVTNIAIDNGALISDKHLMILEQKLIEFQENTQKIAQIMNQTGLKKPLFTMKLAVFSQKMANFCDTLKSAKYKSESDEVIAGRLYKGKESVGYSYNPQHTFDDFKKAMMI